MSKFKVGDRVIVYDSFMVAKGTVVHCNDDDFLKVDIDGPDDKSGFPVSFPIFHPKQCRKLKLKKNKFDSNEYCNLNKNEYCYLNKSYELDKFLVSFLADVDEFLTKKQGFISDLIAKEQNYFDTVNVEAISFANFVYINKLEQCRAFLSEIRKAVESGKIDIKRMYG